MFWIPERGMLTMVCFYWAVRSWQSRLLQVGVFSQVSIDLCFGESLRLMASTLVSCSRVLLSLKASTVTTWMKNNSIGLLCLPTRILGTQVQVSDRLPYYGLTASDGLGLEKIDVKGRRDATREGGTS